MGKTIHCQIMDHTITEDPKALGNGQEVADNRNSLGGGHAARRDAGEMVVL